jgi:hypothetical protein
VCFCLDGSVPIAVRERLMDLGADVVLMSAAKSAFSALFWRFLVADPGVDRSLIRDADSVVNVRERVPVDRWIASGKHFHVMRDFWTCWSLSRVRAQGHVGQDDFVRGAGTAQRDQAGRLLAVPTVTFRENARQE